MSKIVFVRPAEGLRLRAPSGEPIPPEGMALPLDSYVERRLAAGDLILADEVAPETPNRQKKDGR